MLETFPVKYTGQLPFFHDDRMNGSVIHKGKTLIFVYMDIFLLTMFSHNMKKFKNKYQIYYQYR